jgi:predicted dehydrogenase
MPKHLRAVLVGCGGISAAWLKPARETPGLEITGLVDLVEAAARQRAAEFNLPEARIGTDLAAMLDETNPDLVFDCTPPDSHVTVTLKALQHGCHVLGEKPMADSMVNARRMVTAAAQAGKLYAVIQNRRYLAQIRRLRQFVASGAIGPLNVLNSDFYIGAHFGGFRDQMQHALLLDMAIHTFDAARFLSGSEAISVYCKEWNPAGSWYAHGAAAVAIFEMADGSIYNYRGSWCAEGLMTSWESDWRLIGQKGSARWDGADYLAAQVKSGPGGFISELREADVPPFTGPDKVRGHSSLIAEFVECVRTGRSPETTCTDNIKSLAMVFGALESAQSDRPVTIRT